MTCNPAKWLRICAILVAYVSAYGFPMRAFAQHVPGDEDSLFVRQRLGTAIRGPAVIGENYVATSSVLASNPVWSDVRVVAHGNHRLFGASMEPVEILGFCDRIWLTLQYPGARFHDLLGESDTRRFVLPSDEGTTLSEFPCSTTTVLSIKSSWHTSGGWLATAEVSLRDDGISESRVGSATAGTWAFAMPTHFGCLCLSGQRDSGGRQLARNPRARRYATRLVRDVLLDLLRVGRASNVPPYSLG